MLFLGKSYSGSYAWVLLQARLFFSEYLYQKLSYVLWRQTLIYPHFLHFHDQPLTLTYFRLLNALQGHYLGMLNFLNEEFARVGFTFFISDSFK